jgi:uncharacterized protein
MGRDEDVEGHRVFVVLSDYLVGRGIVILDNLNHVMQTAKTGSPMEFGTLQETIAPVALRTIGDWITAIHRTPTV